LLFAIKTANPKTVVILRGNHESRNMTEMFTFRNECIDAYDEEVYEYFMDCFDLLPLACHVADKYLAMHGGISPEFEYI